jgi:hypothetical protein
MRCPTAHRQGLARGVPNGALPAMARRIKLFGRSAHQDELRCGFHLGWRFQAWSW